MSPDAGNSLLVVFIKLGVIKTTINFENKWIVLKNAGHDQLL